MLFCGQHWQRVPAGRRGPGPNLFLPQNVSLDQRGLQLSIRKTDGLWSCAEVRSEASFGYGIYRFSIAAGAERLDPQAVLGLFCYRDPEPHEDLPPEIDIELSRWGNPTTPPITYAIWSGRPGVSHLSERHGPLPAGPTCHSFDWGPAGIRFYSTDDAGQPLAQRTLTFPDSSLNPLPPLRVHLNLWLYQGKTPGGPQEILITRFEHTPREENPSARV